MKEVLAEILKLSTEEKILLVEAIWDNIDQESQRGYDLSDEEKSFLNDRLEAYYKNPDDVTSWEDFKKELASKRK